MTDPSVDAVRTSDDEGMRLAVDHLAGLGHREIAYVDGGSGAIATARRRAYRAAMRRRGLGDGIRVVRGGDSLDAGVAAARVLLDGVRRPTAVIGYNDDVAAGLLESFASAGSECPGTCRSSAGTTARSRACRTWTSPPCTRTRSR